MSNIWFTSDCHFGHKLVAGLRGFDSTDAHDDALIENWKSTVGPDDTVWVLGDLTCTRKDDWVEHVLDFVFDLPGRKHFVAGNHDPVHPMHKQAYKYQRLYLSAFESVQPFAKIKVEGKYVLLSHFPYTFDHTSDARYTQWRLPDEGLHLLHGHTHSDVKVSSPTELHVGLDAWDLKPVSLREVERFVRDGDLS